MYVKVIQCNSNDIVEQRPNTLLPKYDGGRKREIGTSMSQLTLAAGDKPSNPPRRGVFFNVQSVDEHIRNLVKEGKLKDRPSLMFVKGVTKHKKSMSFNCHEKWDHTRIEAVNDLW